MKYRNIKAALLPGRKNTQMTTVAIIAGIAIGTAIGALFATSKGRALKGKIVQFTGNLFDELTGNTQTRANEKLGNLITDVRSHIKQNAEGLLNPNNKVGDKIVAN